MRLTPKSARLSEMKCRRRGSLHFASELRGRSAQGLGRGAVMLGVAVVDALTGPEYNLLPVHAAGPAIAAGRGQAWPSWLTPI